MNDRDKDMVEQKTTGTSLLGGRKRAMLVVNPVAGANRGISVIAPSIRALSEAGYITTSYTTTCAGDAIDVVSRYASETELLICSGGDGTVNEVVRGLMTLPRDDRPPVGYIPTGSTNDFSTALKLPKRADLLIQNAIYGRDMWLDVGSFNGRHYNYLASFGAFTDMCYSTPQEVKNALGFIAYFGSSLTSIANIRPIRSTVIMEDVAVTGEFAFAAVTNTPSVVGLINYGADKVCLNDGSFEVILIRYPENAADLGVIARSITTGNFEDKRVMKFTASEVRFHFDIPIAWILDGEEQDGSCDVTIRNCPRAIRMRVPE